MQARIKQEQPDLYNLLYREVNPSNLEAASLSDRLRELEQETERLQGKLKRNREQIDLHKAALAPARKVPLEIWGEIFAFALQGDADSPPPRKDLVNITSVCKTWRNAALGKRRLWSNVKITLPHARPGQYDFLVPWFKRAKGVPKTLRVELDHHEGRCRCLRVNNPGECYWRNPALVKLLSRGPALFHLSVVVPSSKCFGNLMKLVQQSKPKFSSLSWNQLHSLTLEVRRGFTLGNAWNDGPDAEDSSLRYLPRPLKSFTLSLPKAAPELGPFDLEETTSDLPLHIPAPVLSSLTRLTMSCSWGGPQVVQALQHCTKVEDLHLDLSRSVQVEWTLADHPIPALENPGYITLPNVHTLSVTFTCPTTARRILGYLRFPSVTTLRIGALGGTPAQTYELNFATDRLLRDILDTLGVLSPERGTQIRSLTVGRKDSEYAYGGYAPQAINPQDLVRSLAFLPGLTHLSLDADFPVREFLTLLRGVEGVIGRKVLSVLEHLELTRLSDNFGLESIFRYVRDRQKYKKRRGRIVLEEPVDSLRKLTLQTSWTDRRSSWKAKNTFLHSKTLEMLTEEPFDVDAEWIEL